MHYPSYRERAKIILKKRAFRKAKMDRIKLKQIRVSFVEYVQKGHFKNVLDLIIEWCNLNLDSDDPKFVIEELLKQENVSVVTALDYKNNEIKIIIFEKVFGLTIQFVRYPNLDQYFFCHILRNGSSIKNNATDINVDLLETLVADYFEDLD